MLKNVSKSDDMCQNVSLGVIRYFKKRVLTSLFVPIVHGCQNDKYDLVLLPMAYVHVDTAASATAAKEHTSFISECTAESVSAERQYKM